MNQAPNERRPWSRAEVVAAVNDYFAMLRMDLLGQRMNKSLHNRQLQQVLDHRNASSIEMKHRNISAVLVELGVMPLTGYKPLPNYQRILVEIVSEKLATDWALDEAALSYVETPAEIPLLGPSDSLVVERPAAPRTRVAEVRHAWQGLNLTTRDYLAREAKNRQLGRAGEELVLRFEAMRLHEAGQKSLADRVEHIAATRGDGAGYDILSFDDDGRERFIEVKTTAFMAETPFFISPNEISFSGAHPNQFHLYRLFDFRRRPRMFLLQGAVDSNCKLDPVSFRATVL